MAEEPDNIVLVQLREIRAEMREIRVKQDAHDKRFDRVDKRIEDIRETATYGVGLAVMTNHKIDRMADRFDVVEKRIAKFDAG